MAESYVELEEHQKAMTERVTMRLIYFVGHPKQENSALITQVCKDFETVTGLLHGESATRTLLNLYNLHAVRGLLDGGILRFDTSMSGPHHYFGWIDPRKKMTIEFNEEGLPRYFQYKESEVAGAMLEIASTAQLRIVSEDQTLKVSGFNWMHGKSVDRATRESFSIDDDFGVHLVDTAGHLDSDADSLFDHPGILVLEEAHLGLPLLTDAHLYDLSSFRAKVAPNNEPFGFDPALIAAHKHAQHKLRVITYNYGDRYLGDYLMTGSGVFIERHEFIQAITPMTPQCGGFAMLGRECSNGDLELIAVPVPFGFTLLVEVGAIHGDSTMNGLYVMAMTGNHHAMRTADTVFLKNRHTRRNVSVSSIPPSPLVAGERGQGFHLTSDAKRLSELAQGDAVLKKGIKKALKSSVIGSMKSLVWQPVIATGPSRLGWKKTLGTSLPKPHEQL